MSQTTTAVLNQIKALPEHERRELFAALAPLAAAVCTPARKSLRGLLAGSGAGAALLSERERERRRG